MPLLLNKSTFNITLPKYLVENVANADKLPPVGSFSLVMPILTEGGTEAPIRLIGLVKNNTNHGMVVS